MLEKSNFIEWSVYQIHLEIDDPLSGWEIALQFVFDSLPVAAVNAVMIQKELQEKEIHPM